MIEGLTLTPLKIVDLAGGNVMHAVKKSSDGFCGFGEAYFSMIKSGTIKGWKRHNQMTLNLVVPVGEIRFVIYDDREQSTSFGCFEEVVLSIENYQRLTIVPGLWVAFQGMDESTSIVLNIADMEHKQDEVEREYLEFIEYDWELTT